MAGTLKTKTKSSLLIEALMRARTHTCPSRSKLGVRLSL